MNGSQIQALCDQAVALYQAGRHAEAEQACIQIAAADPGNFVALYIRGVIQFVRGEYDAARTAMEAAMAAEPQAPQPLIYIGRLQEMEGRGDLALGTYDKALSFQPDFLPALLSRGTVLGALKRPAEALAAFEQLLVRDQNNIQAHYNRGAVLLEQGRAQQALASFEYALRLAPNLAAAHANRGEALRALGRQPEALAAYDRALALEPGFAAAWNNRAVVLKDLKRLDEALASADKALSLQPDFADAWNNRAVVLRDMERPEDALASCDKALSFQPDYAHAWNNRGVVLRDLKRPDEARACYDKVIALQPDYAEAWNNRGILLRDLKRLDEALADLDKAVFLQPRYADAWNNRGAILRDLHRLDEALASIDRAVALNADSAEIWNNRGATLHGLKRLDEALSNIDKALSRKPDYADAWNNRGPLLWDLKQPEEAAVSFSKALALNPDYDFLLGDYLHAKMKICDWEGFGDQLEKCVAAIKQGRKVSTPFALLGLVDDPSLHRMAARIYTDAKFPPSDALGPAPGRAAGRKLRIGYYSADFHRHATSILMAELLEARDAERFELYGFSFGPDKQDDMRQRVSASFDKFIDVRTMTDRDVAHLSRELGIDIAVDLKGHTGDSRTGIFAAGCAPLQLQYLGYPGTMGAGYFDYVVADHTVLPPESQGDYREKIIRLPHSYQPNDSQRKISSRVFTRAELGLPQSGFVFCCFNNSYKLLPETFESWMRILQAVPDSVLWLLENNPAAAGNLRKQAVARGIDADRLIFAGHMALDEHLVRHRLADLFLDSWPYNAHTTASDALWAGLPVLTCMGKAFAGRVAASLLHAVGLPDLITTSRAEYEALAIVLASDPPRLAGLRAKLAGNRTTMPLFDGKLTARHLEAAYEAVYARHLAGLPPAPIEISA